MERVEGIEPSLQVIGFRIPMFYSHMLLYFNLLQPEPTKDTKRSFIM